MEKSEDRIQFEIVTWFKNNKIDGLIFAIPNGGSRNKIEAMKLKATGVLAGVSDLIILQPNGKIKFVEVKIEKGRQSESQKDFQKKVNDLGFDYYIVRSLDDFIEII